MRSRDCRVCSLFQKCIPSFQPFIHSSHICVPFSGTFLVGVHPWAKKKKTKEIASLCVFHTGAGAYSRVCRQNEISRDFSTVYGRLPIHPPKHGLPANCAIDSWHSCHVSLRWGPLCPELLVALVYVKPAVCSMVSRQQHARTPARTTLVIFSDRVMPVRLNLPTALLYCNSSHLLWFVLPPLLVAAACIRRFTRRLLLHLTLCVCLCRRLAFMLVVHTAAVLTRYVRVSSYLNVRGRAKEGR